MNKNNLAVAVYDSQTQAETAIKELRASGFDMQKLSIISRDNPTNQCAVGDHNTSDRMESWGKTGAIRGGIWGGRFPGVGPLLFAGPVIGWLAGAAKGAVTVDGMS
ncbi:MAG: permease, partial [Verrucomicrobiaceae bacterium]|nr:permease [Verrucomicrobiaceae bacterium]